MTTTYPNRAVAELDHGPVLLLGRPGGLCAALRRALADHDVACTADPRELRTAGTGQALAIVTTETTGPCRFGLRRWREHAAHQGWDDQLTELVVDAAGTVSGLRVLVLCDTTTGTSSQAAISATRQLGQRMTYECALNGVPISSTTYAVIDDATPASTAIKAAVTWCFTHQATTTEDRPY